MWVLEELQQMESLMKDIIDDGSNSFEDPKNSKPRN